MQPNCLFLHTYCKKSCFGTFRKEKMPFFGYQNIPKMRVLGILRYPKKGTSPIWNVPKQLFLQYVCKNKPLGCILRSFDYYKGDFQNFAVFDTFLENLPRKKTALPWLKTKNKDHIQVLLLKVGEKKVDIDFWFGHFKVPKMQFSGFCPVKVRFCKWRSAQIKKSKKTDPT